MTRQIRSGRISHITRTEFTRFCHRCGNIFKTKARFGKICMKCVIPLKPWSKKKKDKLHLYKLVFSKPK